MTDDDIQAALAPFKLGRMLDGVHARDGMVQVSLAIKREEAATLEPLRRQVEAALAALPGVRNAAVVFTAHRPPPPPPQTKIPLDARRIIAVASGKGGVGKSTVAVNLAVALAGQGLRVGLLDADIYGPSLPRMLGVSDKPLTQDGQMIPLEAWGLKCMSIGFLVEPETAMIWRGPMVIGALTQMLGQVAWGTLDVLVVDLPPGTGDVQLTLAQKTALAGAVIVSTPQDLALIDARRAVRMFAQVEVPVLGVVENMSYFACPHCGTHTDVFGHGGAKAEAAKINVPFLGEIPLQLAIREAGDAGAPVVVAAPASEAAAAFRAVAVRLAEAWAAADGAG